LKYILHVLLLNTLNVAVSISSFEKSQPYSQQWQQRFGTGQTPSTDKWDRVTRDVTWVL